MLKKIIFSLFVLAMLVSGCAPGGIRLGMTKDQLVSLKGEPDYSVKLFVDETGGMIWIPPGGDEPTDLPYYIAYYYDNAYYVFDDKDRLLHFNESAE